MFIKKRRSPKTLKHFVSKIDKRLAEFDHTHRLSASQQAEIKKYQQIYRLRDNPIEPPKKKNLWDF